MSAGVACEGTARHVRPAIVIPTYWVDDSAAPRMQGTYDHSTGLNSNDPELERCLASLEQVRNLPRVILLLVCPLSATDDAERRVERIAAAHPGIHTTIVTNKEASRIAERVCQLVPHVSGDAVSLRGYGAIRNMGLAVAAILGHDVVIFLDDDEVVTGSDFMKLALYGLNQETRQRLPIIAKSGYFYDASGSPLADTTKTGVCHRWWTKRIEFNRWMKRALAGTRISRSNYACGGCMALSARAFTRVAFDPYITRGEDLDYLFNLRLFGYDMWFDNQWHVRHLPPAIAERSGRFMQDVYRWFYERAKLAYAARQVEYNQVTPAQLMPYPGAWLSDQLDDRVRKTALVRALFTREHRGYWHIYRHGRDEAQRYARENAHRYLQLQSFWPAIMDGLWGDIHLAALLEHRA